MKRFLSGLACGVVLGAIVAACSSPSASDQILFDPEDGSILVPRMIKTAISPSGTWYTLLDDTRVWVPQAAVIFWPAG